MKLPPRPSVVITGGASGLGRAFACLLAKRNARVLLGDVNLEGAEETARLVREAGGEAHAVRCDVTKESDLVMLADVADDLFGRTDLLINNAGVAVSGAVGEVPLADWEWILRINLWGVVHGCHAFVPRMKKHGGGAVLNVASSAGIVSLPEMAPYNVSKAAVISLSETLYGEGAKHGIAVSVLCPTFFRTNLLDSMRVTEDKQRAAAKKAFEHALMTAEDVAKAAISGLEKGELVVIPQVDGSVAWRLKRLLPGGFYKALRASHKSGLFERLASRGGK